VPGAAPVYRFINLTELIRHNLQDLFPDMAIVDVMLFRVTRNADIERDEEETLLASRPVSDITGIAGRSATKLLANGIKTCLDFARARPSLIRSLLTVTGERLCYELRGHKARRSKRIVRRTRWFRVVAQSGNRQPMQIFNGLGQFGIWSD